MFLIFLCTFFVSVIVSLILVYINQETNGKLIAPFEKYKIRNELYKCKECSRLFRQYQRSLVHAATGKYNCPHCSRYDWSSERISKPDQWMNSHPDCPKINLLSYIKILRAMKSAKRLMAENEAIKRFEEYNKLEVDVDWIMKLQKDLTK